MNPKVKRRGKGGGVYTRTLVFQTQEDYRSVLGGRKQFSLKPEEGIFVKNESRHFLIWFVQPNNEKLYIKNVNAKL